MLGKVRITNTEELGTTSVSNAFIDEFMADANDAQIKIYLYLLRALQSGRATTVPEIADLFNHTERDVKRALQYWEKKGLVHLEYDSKKRLSQICLEDIASSSEAVTVCAPITNGHANIATLPTVSSPSVESFQQVSSRSKLTHATANTSGTLNNELSMIVFAAETYFKKTLSSKDTSAIIYVSEQLGFPADLIDYLLQYTAEHAKGSWSSYFEKTAVSWHDEGIRTLQDAKSRSGRYDHTIYEIMKLLGLSNAPTPFEVDYFQKWLNTYGFSMDIITEACRRTVSYTQFKRVEYTDKTLTNWKKNGVKTRSDIAGLDEAHEKETASQKTSGAKPGAKPTAFTNHKQQQYDFDAIKALKSKT